MPFRPIITGVEFARDLTTTVHVEDGPDVTWGWFGNGLNVIHADSRDEAYAAARRSANRNRGSRQIYANTGNGWTQVDVVRPGDVEMCEWWPEKDRPATGAGDEGCRNESTVSVGKATNWHLCDSCAALPRFKRLTARVPLRRRT